MKRQTITVDIGDYATVSEISVNECEPYFSDCYITDYLKEEMTEKVIIKPRGSQSEITVITPEEAKEQISVLQEYYGAIGDEITVDSWNIIKDFITLQLKANEPLTEEE